MCGIFGAVGHSLSVPTLENVLHVLAHRGPDGNGVFTDESAKVTIAHTRLAVIDLTTGAQPILSQNGNVVVACNGEIYEFERIRFSLEAKGYRFKSKSDSEVIIYLYEEFGLSCFDHLRGEFAFLLYDKAKRIFIAGRDRFGIKPLYFSRLPAGFVFASEMKAIFASGLVVPKLRISALDLLHEQDPEDIQFPFEHIEHVPPATYLTIHLDSDELSFTNYWSQEIPSRVAEPAAEPCGDVPAAWATMVLHALEQAVQLRLRADVPVGLYLSGGIDSSFVGALMKRNLKAQLHSFSISFVGSDKDEKDFARQAANFLGTHHHELPVTRQMLWDQLEDCLWFSELPFFTLAPVGKFLLSKEARKFVTVVLTGEGADEVFLGYRKFFQEAIRDTRQVQATRRSTLARIARVKPGGVYEVLLKRLSLLLFRRNHRRALALARAKARATYNPSKPMINAVQEARIADMPLRILCFLGDRTEMAHSLEARVPFLDHKLYDMAKWIPVDFKMHCNVEKAVLRDAAKGILPEDLRLRPKRGFMHTSAIGDFFGADRALTRNARAYLRKQAFERAQIFSYSSYLVIKLLVIITSWNRGRFLNRLHRFANQAIMYIVQTHMLQKLFIDDSPWKKRDQDPSEKAQRSPASGSYHGNLTSAEF
jgi:asparagine synthase (glutamine-hydrolysing)